MDKKRTTPQDWEVINNLLRVAQAAGLNITSCGGEFLIIEGEKVLKKYECAASAHAFCDGFKIGKTP